MNLVDDNMENADFLLKPKSIEPVKEQEPNLRFINEASIDELEEFKHGENVGSRKSSSKAGSKRRKISNSKKAAQPLDTTAAVNITGTIETVEGANIMIVGSSPTKIEDGEEYGRKPSNPSGSTKTNKKKKQKQNSNPAPAPGKNFQEDI